MTLADLKGKKILVLGLGANNRELAAYLLGKGVQLVIRERSEAARQSFAKAYPEYAVEWQPREGLSGLEGFEVLFRSPGIPYLSPELKKSGALVYSQTRLFLDLCPATVVGVTGTKGKGTTCTLIYQMLTKGYKKGTTYIAGNIGADPFSFLDQLQPEDVVVLELSSFQLQDLHKSPNIAVLLGISRDHQDHHRDMDEYVEAKAQLLAHQTPEDLAIVNDENPYSASLIPRTKATVLRYGKHVPRRQSAWVDVSSGEEVAYVQLGDSLESMSLAGRHLLGEHNLENILPALLVAAHFEVPRPIMQQVAVEFSGLPHRLTKVGEYGGALYVDDSISTVPEAAQAALRSFPGQRIHLIAGGSEKGADYAALATDIIERCVSVSLLPGEASVRLKKAIRKALSIRPDCSCLILDKATEFDTIFSGIQPHLQKGDVILLSPAAASFASFANSKERGELFVKAVAKRHKGS